MITLTSACNAMGLSLKHEQYVRQFMTPCMKWLCENNLDPIVETECNKETPYDDGSGNCVARVDCVTSFIFDNDSDAIFFKLRWSDYLVDASDDDASRNEI